jgi:CRP/FNR family transcriptional regulator, cyclic AMP receptor protein
VPENGHDIRRDALLSSSLFQAMRPEELERILKLATERRYRRGQVIFQKDDPGSSMAAVLSGRVRIGAMSLEGKEITLNMIDAGEVFGEIALLDGKPRSADATAFEDTHLLIIERKNFLPLLEGDKDLALRLLSVLCERLRNTSDTLSDFVMFDLPARLGRTLIKLAADYGRPNGRGVRIGLKLSQNDLSRLVAATRESVNKQMRAWEDSGLVVKEGGLLTISRPEELKRQCGLI